MLKIAKEKNKLLKFLNEKLNISVGFERLLYFILLFVVLCHIVSCLLFAHSLVHIPRVFSVRLDDFGPETWIVRYGYQDSEDWEVSNLYVI